MSVHEKRIVISGANLSVFVTPFLASSVNIALPSIQRGFDCDNLVLNWVVSSYLLVIPMLLVPFGRIADSVGRKRIFTWGMAVFAVASLLCSLSFDIYSLICFRVVQAVGAAMQFSTAMSLIISECSEGERGKVIGMNVAFVYVGLSLGPVLGGLMVQYLGWRSIFYLNAVLSSVIVAMMRGTLGRDFKSGAGADIDPAAMALYGLSIILLMYGFSDLPDAAGVVMILCGLLAGAAFIRMEMKGEHPVLHLRIFGRNRLFIFSNLAALINYSATFGVGYLLSLYFQYAKGLSPSKAGLFLLIQAGVQAVFSPLAGRLSDRHDPGRLASAGMGIVCACLICLCFLDIGTGLAFIAAVQVFLGIGFALFSSPNTNAAMCAVDKEYYGVGSSILGTMRLLGQTSSMAIVMFAASMHIGRTKVGAHNIGDFMAAARMDFAIFSVLCAAGVFFSLVRGSKTRTQ